MPRLKDDREDDEYVEMNKEEIKAATPERTPEKEFPRVQLVTENQLLNSKLDYLIEKVEGILITLEKLR